MMENRSFDHVFGALSLAGRSDIAGISYPMKTNPAPDGSTVPQWCMDGAPFTYNVPHRRRDAVEQYDSGEMDGFVKAYAMENPGDPHWNIPMGFYTAQTFPVLYALASKFTVCDAWHSSMLSSTWPNRKYFHSGQRDGDDDTQTLPAFPGFGTTPLYRALETTPDPVRPGHTLTWKSYFSDLPFLAFWYAFAATHLSSFATIDQFADDCMARSLPHISILDPPFTLADDHPPHNPGLGEKFIGLVVDALTTSPSWEDTLLLLLYDEHGGFFDHVTPPPPAVVGKWGDTPLGFRVPALIVSPFSGKTSHDTFEHASFMNTVHQRWGVLFPEETYDVRWTGAQSIWSTLTETKPLPTGIYTGVVDRADSIASLNWATGVYDRLGDDFQRFEGLLDRIFVLPELKTLDNRAEVFRSLSLFEHKVVTQKRMYVAAAGS
jgi:phospholipase C